MKATLYQPGLKPENVSTEGLSLPDADTGYVPNSTAASILLGCTQQMVDILACNSNIVIYSVFDNEEIINEEALPIVKKIFKNEFFIQEGIEMLYG